MKYTKGYKYQLKENYFLLTHIFPINDIKTPYINLSKIGEINIIGSYAWDGASGPTIDTDNSMTPSLVHDALYQLMRMGELPIKWRAEADHIFLDMLEERGMSWWRRSTWFWGVEHFAADAADPRNKRKVYEVE